MPSVLLDNTHAQKTSSVARHHLPLTAYMIRICRAWHAIFSLGKHTPSGNIRRGIPSSPSESIQDQTTSGVTYYDLPMTEHMIEPRRALHGHMSLRQHTWSNDVGHGNPSSQLCSTLGRMTYRVACPLWPLASTHS